MLSTIHRNFRGTGEKLQGKFEIISLKFREILWKHLIKFLTLGYVSYGEISEKFQENLRKIIRKFWRNEEILEAFPRRWWTVAPRCSIQAAQTPVLFSKFFKFQIQNFVKKYVTYRSRASGSNLKWRPNSMPSKPHEHTRTRRMTK